MKIRSSAGAAACSVLAVVALTACGGNANQKPGNVDYKSGARAAKSTLEVPPDLIAPARDDRFSVPDASTPERGTASLSSYTAGQQQAPAANTAKLQPVQSDTMHVERAGDERWLVIKGTQGDLWPQLRAFWEENGFVLTTDNPQVGVMETDWLENRAKLPQDWIRRNFGAVIAPVSDTGMRDRFRARIEPGKDAGTVDLFITHRGIQQVCSDDRCMFLQWQPRRPDPGLEDEMMRLFMVKLAGGNEEKVAQIVAQPDNRPVRAALTNTTGDMQLAVDGQIDRVWRQLGSALDRVGLVVEDRDRAKNTYFVRYVSADDLKQKEDGWISRMFSSKPAPGTNQYRIVAEAAGEKTLVRVQDKDGKQVSSESARQILSLLLNELK
ncbi:MAG: outer membrane protein assembly factor BamC [Rhodocyclaceae bacterium]